MILPTPGMFAVQVFADELERVVARYGTEVHQNSELVEIGPDSRRAVIVDHSTDTKDPITYDMRHVVPPQSAPDWLKANPLADPASPAGYVEIDKNTMRHVRYDNVFALGHAGSSPNSKTGAAIRKQAPVVAKNVLASLKSQPLPASYDGYASCPLTTSRHKMLLSEFDYTMQPRPSFPVINTTKERRDSPGRSVRHRSSPHLQRSPPRRQRAGPGLRQPPSTSRPHTSERVVELQGSLRGAGTHRAPPALSRVRTTHCPPATTVATPREVEADPGLEPVNPRRNDPTTHPSERPVRGLVVHVPDAESSGPVLRNVTNLLTELGSEVAVEVVAHGPSIDLLLAGNSHDEVSALIGRRVVFSACRNTLRSRSLPTEALVPGVLIVASGMARVTQLQWSGSAYLRP